MKKDIHPNYYETKVTCVTCGATFTTGSTVKEIKVDTDGKIYHVHGLK